MKNDVKLTLRVSADDMALLKSRTKATRLSQSAYLRMLIRGRVPKAYPPQPFYEVLPALQTIAGELTAIAETAQARGEISAPEYRTTTNRLFAKILALERELTDPEPIESG